MMKVKGIFAVSFIAMMVVGGAYADIASSGYVDEKINGLAIPTVNDATLTIQKNGTTVDTFTANASANKTINITVPTTTSQLTNNSGFITAANLPVATANALGGVKSGGDITVGTDGAVTVNSATQADSATTAASAIKASQDASGNVITSTYATKTELSAKQNASTAVEVATAGAAVGDSTHPVYVNASGVATKIDKVAAAAKADTATSATNATNATNATKASQDASGNVITSTYATKTELTSGLSGKQATLSAAQLNAVNSGITSTKVSTYDGYSAKITAAQDAADDAADAAAAAQSTASGKLSSISGSTGGTGNVVTSVSASGSTVSATKGITAEETKNKVTSVRAAASATDTAYPSEKAVATALAGKVSTAQGSGNANKAVITNASGNITTGQIASGMIADDAVTSAKLAAGAVDATALASGAVTSAKIADGTITNADISASAAIDASKISGLSTVATTGSYDDLADKPTIPSAYVLKAATSSALGGVKSGGYITVGTDGAVTVNSATHAARDASGNVITETYATKSQITALDSTSSGTGAVVTDVSQTDGKVSVTKGNVQIPFGGQNATDYAAIWVE